jgi:flagellar hook-associated protein 1 FlgK
MDGAIGTTQGLVIGVYDANGAKITDLQVGAGYQPGTELEVADGVKVAFGFGQVSATDHDLFQVEVIADSDTARALPALGLNNFFDGLDASSIAVRDDLLADPDRLAASRSGAVGDAGNLLRMIAVESQGLASLGGASLNERFSEIVGEVGFELQSSSDAHDAEQVTLSTLETRRERISGVNPDEELVEMIEQQQAYAAAAQYLRVINDITSELINLI